MCKITYIQETYGERDADSCNVPKWDDQNGKVSDQTGNARITVQCEKHVELPRTVPLGPGLSWKNTVHRGLVVTCLGQKRGERLWGAEDGTMK